MAMQLTRGQQFRAMGDELATAETQLLTMGLAAHPERVRDTLLGALGRRVTDDEVEAVLRGLRMGKITARAPRELHIQAMAHVHVQRCGVRAGLS